MEGSCSRTLPLKSIVSTSAGVMVAKDGPKRFTSIRFSPTVMLRCPALPTLRPKRNSSRAAQQRSNFNACTFINSLQDSQEQPQVEKRMGTSLFIFVQILHQMLIVFTRREKEIQIHNRLGAQRLNIMHHARRNHQKRSRSNFMTNITH